jgi:hypothetical protein
MKVPASNGDRRKAERLAKALRANLKRRKSQARAKDQPAVSDGRDAKEPENAQDSGEK